MSILAKMRMSWFCLLSLFAPFLEAQNQVIYINLTPRDYVDPRTEKDFVCGQEKQLDDQRLLAELNSPYIFSFLNKFKDPNTKYKTRTFDVAAIGQDGRVENMLDQQCPLRETALFSLFVLPPTLQCNSMTFEDAIEAKEGYYPIFVGVSSDFSTQINRFIQEASNFKHIQFGQRPPKLCATSFATGNETAHSRRTTLTSLFNFLYNENSRKIDMTKSKSCYTAEETENALEKMFDRPNDIWFEDDIGEGSESEGVAKLKLYRNNKTIQNAGLAFVQTSFDSNGLGASASIEDIEPYDGPIFFQKDEATALVYVVVKTDNVTEEDEYFSIEIKEEMKKRKKRSLEDVKTIIMKGDYDSRYWTAKITGLDWTDKKAKIAETCTPEMFEELKEPMHFIFNKKMKMKVPPNSDENIFAMIIHEYTEGKLGPWQDLEVFDRDFTVFINDIAMFIDDAKEFGKLNFHQRAKIFREIYAMKVIYLQYYLMNVATLFEGNSVYRIEIPMAENIGEEKSPITMDQEIERPHFVSTSRGTWLKQEELGTDGLDINLFTDKWIIENPTHGVDIQKFADEDHKNQREVLFPIGVIFVVTKVEEDGDVRTITVREKNGKEPEKTGKNEKGGCKTQKKNVKIKK